MKGYIDRFKRMCVVGIRQIQDPYYHGFAAQISFYLMLSIVPCFLLIIQLLGVFNISTETALEVLRQYTGGYMAEYFETVFHFNYIGLGNVVFLFIALWSGSRAAFVIARITNYTMTEGRNTGRNYFIERIRAMLTMTLILIGLIIALIILCYGKVLLLTVVKLMKIQNATTLVNSFWLWLRWPLGFFLYLFIMGYIYYILPTEKRPFRVVMPGACFASAGILVVSWGYSYYTGTLVNYDITYGALSTVVAMMMWFLLLSWVILLGIMINKVLIDTKKPFSKMEPPEHLEISERQHANKSKFDINPDDVNLRTIGDILMNNDKVQHVENPIKKIKRK